MSRPPRGQHAWRLRLLAGQGDSRYKTSMGDWNTETAEWYAEKFGEYPTNRLAIDVLALAPDSVVVDVGCGTGAALRHAASIVTDGTLIGVDPVPRMIEIARERTAAHGADDRIEYREGSAEALPVADGVADVVLAFDSMDHWKDRAQGLAELRRILRPQGRVALVKDGGLPDGADATSRMHADLRKAGFRVLAEREIEQDEVSFSMWVCEIARV